jgi:hypothetical protein
MKLYNKFANWFDKSVHDECHLLCKTVRTLMGTSVALCFGVPMGMMEPVFGTLILLGSGMFILLIWFK